jgi:hypothetical protein
MNANPQLLAFQQIHDLCQGHAEALSDALQDMATRDLTLAEYSHLSKEDRRLLDQFAYRYTRLQDDMGARLMPAMSAIDRFARLEQLGWLPSADTWNELRQIRNQFTHDYPDATAERFDRLTAATDASRQLLSVMDQFNQRLSGQLLKS